MLNDVAQLAAAAEAADPSMDSSPPAAPRRLKDKGSSANNRKRRHSSDEAKTAKLAPVRILPWTLGFSDEELERRYLLEDFRATKVLVPLFSFVICCLSFALLMAVPSSRLAAPFESQSPQSLNNWTTDTPASRSVTPTS